MIKQLCLILLALIPFNSLASQEVKHAPTLEQCRADQKLWLSKLEEPGTTALANVDFNELNGWAKEMRECGTVDPEFHHQYDITNSEASYERLSRLGAFLVRHNLTNQFLTEDAQGQR